jgi:hypothetical protein
MLKVLMWIACAGVIACGAAAPEEPVEGLPVVDAEESAPGAYSTDIKLGPSCTWISNGRRCFDLQYCPGGGNVLCLTTSSDASCAPTCKCACDR